MAVADFHRFLVPSISDDLINIARRAVTEIEDNFPPAFGLFWKALRAERLSPPKKVRPNLD